MDYKKIFDEYVKSYNLDDELIKLKYNHSYRVMKLCEKYSKKLGFSDYDVKLMSMIGLYHDIGRFEQIKKYNNIINIKNIDHADYGVKILFDDMFISKVWNNEEDYEIIKYSIKYHNKLDIPEFDSKRINKFIKLIRDVDKIDILYLLGTLKEHELKSTSDKLSNEVINSIMKHELIHSNDIKNPNDDLASEFAYAFDINYDECLEEFKNNLSTYYKFINNEEIFKDIYNEVINYIDERIDRNVRN